MSSKSIFHSLSATTGDGSVMEMSSLAGKVVYATNVASK
jgi:glutathione peroxidase-family protein